MTPTLSLPGPPPRIHTGAGGGNTHVCRYVKDLGIIVLDEARKSIYCFVSFSPIGNLLENTGGGSEHPISVFSGGGSLLGTFYLLFLLTCALF